MRNIKLVIEYDGTNFVGWQIQPNGRSVQGEIKKAIKEITGEDVNLIGASRTDAGVTLAVKSLILKQTQKFQPKT